MVSDKLINRLQIRWDINGANYEKLQGQSMQQLMEDSAWHEDFKRSAWKYAVETGDRTWEK